MRRRHDGATAVLAPPQALCALALVIPRAARRTASCLRSIHRALLITS